MGWLFIEDWGLAQLWAYQHIVKTQEKQQYKPTEKRNVEGRISLVDLIIRYRQLDVKRTYLPLCKMAETSF